MFTRDYWFSHLKKAYPTCVTDASRFEHEALGIGATISYDIIGSMYSMSLFKENGDWLCGSGSIGALTVNNSKLLVFNQDNMDYACKKLRRLNKNKSADEDDEDFIQDLRSL